MKQLIYIIAVAAVMTACNKKNNPKQKTEVKDEKVEKVVERDFKAEGFFEGSMKDMTELDGCQFMIVLEKGDRLNPIDLPEEFKVDGMKVWVKYKAKPDIPSICMSGKVASIIAIEKQ